MVGLADSSILRRRLLPTFDEPVNFPTSTFDQFIDFPTSQGQYLTNYQHVNFPTSQGQYLTNDQPVPQRSCVTNVTDHYFNTLIN